MKSNDNDGAAKSTAPAPLEMEQSNPDAADEAVAMLKGTTDGDDNEVELSASLTPNTYSILFVSDPKSLAFFFGLFFFVFQVGLASLSLVDLLDLNSKNNIMKVPAGVPTYVRVGKCVMKVELVLCSISLPNLSIFKSKPAILALSLRCHSSPICWTR